jgi:hypothetical protein
MSYDLYFEAGAGKRLDRKSFAAYFKGRANYKPGKGQAIYQNEDTGVYFMFDEPSEGVVAFNLNYFRPHVFGLEAAPELEAFAAAFAARVTDPQNEGMGEDAAFTREGFLRGWNAGNRFGYRAILSEQTDQPIHTWPARRIREVWAWNFARAAEQERAGEEMFVPAIFATAVEGEVWSVAIWPPECPILLPAVDAVLVPLAQSGKQSNELALVRWEEVLAVVKSYQVKGVAAGGAGLARYRLAFEDWPAEVAAFLGNKRRAVGEMNGVGLDGVLDQELVEEGRR